MASAFDFLIAGDDAPSLIAAAAAARAGASTLIVAPKKNKQIAPPSFPDIPNFVWRRLNLQDHNFSLQPVSARITLLDDGVSAQSFRTDRETAETLQYDDPDAAALLPVFSDEMRALGASADKINDSNAEGVPAALAVLFDDDGLSDLSDLSKLSGAANEVLDDYLNGGPVSSHISTHALSLAGLGGEEAGSAQIFPEFFDDAAWRARTAKGSQPLMKILHKICAESGVVMQEGMVSDISPEGAKANSVSFGNDEKIRINRIFFASPDSAAEAGYSPGAARQTAFNGASATLRLRLRKPIAAPAGDKSAIFQIVDGTCDLRASRHAALTGKLPEKPPVQFEFVGDNEIVAHTAYIPNKLCDEEGWRAWTGQDRQLLMRIMMDRLSSRLDDLGAKVRKQEIVIQTTREPMRDVYARARNIYMQSKRHNAIAAAVKLVDRALNDG
ncbi:MAG: hypothetical protein AAGD92_13325 [Pseudomonadota bacterium]